MSRFDPSYLQDSRSRTLLGQNSSWGKPDTEILSEVAQGANMTTHDKRIATKAATIIAERRIRPLAAKVFTVIGSTGAYVVTVWGYDEEDASCTCEAGRRGTMCSHVLAGLRMYAAPGHFR